ncbi:MAG TPA: PepSY domain-containing protein, partial [Macellibacteroides fermentans]|nr:PepSY domain-containing protein [Macellibacteroides fermentans]
MKGIRQIITRFIYTIHRMLGTLLSILFLMWFLSGLVMMYHTFPKVWDKEKLQKTEILDSLLPPIETIVSRIPWDE